MSGEPESRSTSVADAYKRHNDRWRDAMRRINLNPDSRADQYAVPSGFWFELHDQLRRDLTSIGGVADDVIVKRHVRSHSGRDELAMLDGDLKRLMGHA